MNSNKVKFVNRLIALNAGLIGSIALIGGINPLPAQGIIAVPVPPGQTPGNPLLPTTTPGVPGFNFQNFTVGNNGLGTTNPIFIDPDVAVGYDYLVTGGPLFASVLIPNALPKGDSNFLLDLGVSGIFSLFADPWD